MKRLLAIWLGVLALTGCPAWVQAGGSGLNVVVVVNGNSSNSVQLGNYYCEERQVPPQNFLRINWTGTNVEWTDTDFTNTLLNPLLAMLAGNQLTNQIDYVVLSMDIPYRVNGGTNGENSTTSALFYGFMADSRDLGTCPLAPGSSNLYAGSESIFRLTPPISGISNAFLVTMITGTSLDLAKAVVDQGVASDGTFPTQTVVLEKTDDTARNVRYAAFDNAIFNTRLLGYPAMLRTNSDSTSFSNLLGFQTGLADFYIPPNTFVPGAMADSLTSFGGQIFEDSGQTSLLRILDAGATGSFGTVVEPCNYPQKFPDPQDYFYQGRGFSLAECYYQSLTNPYQGLIVGEPLAAPFAKPGSGQWSSPASNAVLAGTTNLALQFNASDAQHPLQQVDLFLDGNWLTTVTNIAPKPGDVLNVTLNGQSTNYAVPSNASIASVATGLAGVLNGSGYASVTKAQAVAHGDRVELQSQDATKTGAQLSLVVNSTNGSGAPTTFVTSSGSNFLDSIAWGIRTNEITGVLDTNSFLQIMVTKTNNQTLTLAVTNSSNLGLTAFVQQLLDLINNTPALQGADGLRGEDLVAGSPTDVYFNLRAIGPGYAAAQIQAVITGSLTQSQNPIPEFTDNLPDLQPRCHIYIAAGTTNLALSVALNTTNLADGYHELTGVAYEGSHVRTQAQAAQKIRIQNTALNAVFTTLVGGSNSAIEATLQFRVTASGGVISQIALFSTGGLLAAASNQSTATFSIPATNLDLGLHPFYAIVTDNGGRQYRTDVQWIRLIGMDAPFLVNMSAPPPLLVWPATAGRSYDILSAAQATNVFQLRTTIIPTNTIGQWIETNTSPVQQFYRVRITP